MWAAVAAVAGVVLLVIQLWAKANDTKAKEKADAKKETKDAVDSGDVSRINAVIQRLRR